MWDYIFSGIEDDGRYFLKTEESHFSIYQDESYFNSHSDLLINLDYVCLALLQY